MCACMRACMCVGGGGGGVTRDHAEEDITSLYSYTIMHLKTGS